MTLSWQAAQQLEQLKTKIRQPSTHYKNMYAYCGMCNEYRGPDQVNQDTLTCKTCGKQIRRRPREHKKEV